MFKFLKEKLGNVVKKFSKEVEEEADIEEVKEIPQEEKEKPTKVVEQKSVKKEESEPEEKTAESQEEEPVKKEPELKSSKEKIEVKKEPSKKEKPVEPEPKEIELEIPEKDTTKEDHATKKEESILEESKEESDEESEEKEPEKKKESFFSKIFHKKKEETKEEELPQDEEELTEELEEAEQKKSEKKKDDVKNLEPKKKEFFQKPEETSEEKEVQEKELEELKKAPQEEKKKELEEKITEEKKELESLKESPEEPKPKKEKTEQGRKEEESEEKKGFFKKVSESFTKINLSEQKFEELFWDIEITLLENNVAVEVIELIKKDLKDELTTDKISRKNVEKIILDTLKSSLDKVLTVPEIDIEKEIEKKKPYIIAVIGVNGSGKTTAIAKLTNYLKNKNHSVVLAAADTFRAAAIQQLEEHANKLDVKLIKHDYNSDPAAVAFDAVKHAEAKNIDVVIIDTAGRMHSNDNLMNELKKLIRVNKPDLKIFVGESITGNDCVEQARTYNAEIGIDAIILTKADIDEKGGAAISISHITQKPILFIGTGQKYDDLEKFNKEKILESLGL